jgi:hypothetical protein
MTRRRTRLRVFCVLPARSEARPIWEARGLGIPPRSCARVEPGPDRAAISFWDWAYESDEAGRVRPGLESGLETGPVSLGKPLGPGKPVSPVRLALVRLRI